MILEESKMEFQTHPEVTPEDESDEENVVSDVESSNKESDASDGGEVEGVKSGWADSVAKILRTTKPKGKKTLVLSRAKKLTDVRKEKPEVLDFQIDGEIKEEKPDPLQLLDEIKKEKEEGPPKKKKKDVVQIRVKPNILDRDRERTLAKIATRGVVQLFNAVREQQKELQGRLQDAGPLERNKEKVLKSIDKRQFLNVLMGENAKSQPVDRGVKKEETTKNDEETNSESEKETTSSWGVLREDFMMGAKYKDWDKAVNDDDDDDNDDI